MVCVHVCMPMAHTSCIPLSLSCSHSFSWQPLIENINARFEQYLEAEVGLLPCRGLGGSHSTSIHLNITHIHTRILACCASPAHSRQPRALSSVFYCANGPWVCTNNHLMLPTTNCCQYRAFVIPYHTIPYHTIPYHTMPPRRLRSVDIEALKELQHVVNIVPLVAKADTLTPADLAHFKGRVWRYPVY